MQSRYSRGMTRKTPIFSKKGAARRRFRCDERGAAALVVAGALPAIMGFMALGLETGHWYASSARLQTAADMAAHAAALEMEVEGRDDERATLVAQDAAFQFDVAADEVNVVVSETNAGLRADVDITRTLPRYLSYMFNSDSTVKVDVDAAAVVESGGEACLVALDPDGDGVDLGGNTSMSLNGCLVASNATDPTRSISVTGAASLAADCAASVGGTYVQKDGAAPFSRCSKARTGIKPVVDPYADVVAPDLTKAPFDSCVGGGGGGKGKKGGGALAALTSGRYCGGLNFSGVVNIADGATIVLDGGQLKNTGPSSLIGNNVTIILMNDAEIKLTSKATLDLKSKTTGDYAGLIFFGDSATQDDVEHEFNGGSLSSLRGAVYLPTDRLDLRGGANMSVGCLHFIAAEIDARGNSRMANSCDNSGTRPVKVAGGVRMAE